MIGKSQELSPQLLLFGIVAIVAIVGLVTLLIPGIQKTFCETQLSAYSDAAYDAQDSSFYSGSNLAGEAKAVAYNCWIEGGVASGETGCGTHTGSVLAKACRDAGGTCHNPNEVYKSQ